MTRAAILLSDGLDSATVLAIAKSEGRECHALSIVYGQRHVVELERRGYGKDLIIETYERPRNFTTFPSER